MSATAVSCGSLLREGKPPRKIPSRSRRIVSIDLHQRSSLEVSLSFYIGGIPASSEGAYDVSLFSSPIHFAICCLYLQTGYLLLSCSSESICAYDMSYVGYGCIMR
eukprot:GHVU01177202.1.p1 GENE.GHVU01177202.1~~GHVU01177202.1.p1  ORF type:complete len:106 (+),score=2.49 GHVU01177202.1:29-346(+)